MERAFKAPPPVSEPERIPGRLSAKSASASERVGLILTPEHFADPALWPVAFEPRRKIEPSMLKAINGGHAIDEDAELAKAGTELAGEILCKTILVLLAVVSTYLVVTL